MLIGRMGIPRCCLSCSREQRSIAAEHDQQIRFSCNQMPSFSKAVVIFQTGCCFLIVNGGYAALFQPAQKFGHNLGQIRTPRPGNNSYFLV